MRCQVLHWYKDRYSVLPALSLNGILYASIVEGSFNTALFKDFIKGLLNQMQPYPAPNSVIVMDNCRIHKSLRIREMIEARFVLIIIFQMRCCLTGYVAEWKLNSFQHIHPTSTQLNKPFHQSNLTCVDEPSSSVGLYFRIFAHFGSRVTLTVTLLSSQCYYCPAEVISLSGRGHFIVLSF